jgi:phosphate transport system permease protein
VVLPTARSGLVTASLLAVARVAGETAPAVLTAGQRNSINTNLFSGNQQNLPLMIWQSIRTPTDTTVSRGYTAALVLVGLVLVLFVSARVLSAGSPLATGRRAWKWLRSRRHRHEIVVDLRDPVDPLVEVAAGAPRDHSIWQRPSPSGTGPTADRPDHGRDPR